MVAKVLFLFLLGTALAFANPLPAENKPDSTPAAVNTIANEVVSQDPTDVNVDNVSVTDQPLEIVTEKNEALSFFQKGKRFLKDIGSKLINTGKKALTGSKEILETVKELAKEGKRFIIELKDQLNSKNLKETIDSAKSFIAEVKKTGSEAYGELKSTIKELTGLFEHHQEPAENEKKID